MTEDVKKEVESKKNTVYLTTADRVRELLNVTNSVTMIAIANNEFCTAGVEIELEVYQPKSHIHNEGFYTSGGKFIRAAQLEYFDIKDDKDIEARDALIATAVKAVRDGVIYTLELVNSLANTDIIGIRKSLGTGMLTFTRYHYEEGIEYINSLYTETFVIESEEDIRRIKPNAKAKLANSVEVLIKEAIGSEYVNACEVGSVVSITLNIISLKGATVTQKRSSHE